MSDSDLSVLPGAPARYDRVTITFHWLTAVLVVLLFGSAWVWNNTPRDWGLHQPLEAFHVSFGILFAAVLIGRIVWRLWRGRRLGSQDKGSSACWPRACISRSICC